MMAKRVAGDKALDLDGMKQAVRNAVEIYENEIAGRPVVTNLDGIVGRALGQGEGAGGPGPVGLGPCDPAQGGGGDAARRGGAAQERFVSGRDGALHSGARYRAG